MKRIMGTTLQGCGCTPQEWQWTESEEMEDPGENYDGDIMQWLEDNILDWTDVEITDKHNGRIHWLRDGIVLGYKDGSGPCEMYWVEDKPARISINNAATFYDAGELDDDFMSQLPWQVIVNCMDDDTREKVHAELAPCSDLDFLKRYLELAPTDLVIG